MNNITNKLQEAIKFISEFYSVSEQEAMYEYSDEVEAFVRILCKKDELK